MNKIYRILTIDFDKNRIYGLDILRTVAILSVLIIHGSSIISPIFKNTFLFVPDGVSIFFVLSGFLIGGIILKIIENKPITFITLATFWSRRWLRTLPLYYGVLILLLILSWLFIEDFNIAETKQFFVFLQNFNKSHSYFFNVSWSLSVEEWFYLLTPSALFFIIGIVNVKPEKAVIFTAVAVILCSVVYRFYRYQHIIVDNFETFDVMFRRPVITRLDSLMFGVLGACLFFYKKLFWASNRNIFFITGIALHILIKAGTATFFRTSAFYYCNLSLVFEPLATLLLLPFLTEINTGKGIVYKIITVVSLISYSLYLLHAEIVQNWIIKFINLGGIANIPQLLIKYFLYWFITIILSILSYKYIEVPFMRLRNKKE